MFPTKAYAALQERENLQSYMIERRAVGKDDVQIEIDNNVSQSNSSSENNSPELKKIQVMLSHVICNRVLAIISFYFTFFSFTSIRSIFAFGFEKKKTLRQ